MAIAAACCAVAAAQAQVDPSNIQALQWRSIGPFRGGRVLTVAGIPGDARHFYFGAVDGGVWATEDTGRTWQPIFDSEPAGSIGAVAVAPGDPNTIYVGTGEADMRSDIAHGNGMYKSTDAGKHWMRIGLEDSRQVGKILVDPRNKDRVFVAALGHAYGANDERGVFRSDDGGAHWSKVLFLNADTGAIDLAFKPNDPDTIYASLWQTRRPPWSVYPPSCGAGSGLYVSHDGGEHWTHVEGDGFAAHPCRIGLAVSNAAPDRVYALVDSGIADEGGLYRSDDAGAHWEHATGDKRIWQRGWYFSGVTADPHNADRVTVMDTIVLRSDDGGRHFMALKGDPTGDDFHTLWIDPTDSERQILGSDQGTQITVNGGKTWSSWYNQPTAQIYHVATDNRFPYWVYGAQQDSGAVSLPSRTDGGDGITMSQFHETTAGGESNMIAPDPKNPKIVYGGRVDKLDLDSNQTRDVDPTLAYPTIHYRAAWTLPLAFSARDPKALYYANQKLFRTTDGGNHWDVISPDLARADSGVPANLDTATAADDDHDSMTRGVIYTIAPSPLSANALWVGTDDGLVWRTDDLGKHWRNVTPQGLTPWSKIGGIALSPFNANVAYLAIDRHRLEDDRPHICYTDDGGAHWKDITQGIPDDAFVNVVREDPVRKGLLYAGTERGMFVSFDNGAHWQSLQQNLPMTSVRDIDIHGDDLVIATHGRGFWIMDDVTALRQVQDSAPSTLVLFKPADAIRQRIAPFTGTPRPRDEPLAQNPPSGAVIDYIVPSSVGSPVTLTITDAQNHVVKTFTSAEEYKAPDAMKTPVAPEWMPVPPRLFATAGMHRFVWDLRYAPFVKPAGEERRAQGVWAPPGHYTVAMTANGETMRAPLLVKPDPRVHVTDAALAHEFDLARKVEAQAAQATAALADATKLLKALAAHGPGKSYKAIAEVAGKATDLSGVDLHPDPRFMSAYPRRADSLRALSADLAKLGSAVDSADAEPTKDMSAAYATLTKMLAATLREWQTLKDRDLPALNATLKAADEQPITP